MNVFSLIHPHLQQNVIEKLTFAEFTLFSACSHNSREISKSLKRRLYLKANKAIIRKFALFPYKQDRKRRLLTPILNEFPIKIHFDLIWFTKYNMESCQEIVKLLENGLISTKKVRICCKPKRISPELFNRLLKSSGEKNQLKVSQVKQLSYEEKSSHGFLLQPEVQNVTDLQIQTQEPISIQLLLTIKASKIHLYPAFLTPQELNLFLKQWHQGTRKIDEIQLNFGETPVPVGQDEEMFSEIPHQLIWSKEFHSKSVISDWSMEKMERWREVFRSYALKKGDEQLFVLIFGYAISIQRVSDPFEAFGEFVTPIE